MHDADITNSNTLPHEVKINLNVFGVLMLDRVGGHVDGADVVAIDQRSAPRRCLELDEKLHSQVASAKPLATARYSASALDLDTMFCRFDD